MGKTVFRNNSKYSSTFSSVLIFSSSGGIVWEGESESSRSISVDSMGAKEAGSLK
jgi:hypothetical protein